MARRKLARQRPENYVKNAYLKKDNKWLRIAIYLNSKGDGARITDIQTDAAARLRTTKYDDLKLIMEEMLEHQWVTKICYGKTEVYKIIKRGQEAIHLVHKMREEDSPLIDLEAFRDLVPSPES